MFNVGVNNSIMVNRGDTFSIPLYINMGTDMNPIQYELMQGAEVYLGVTEPNQLFEDAIIKKKYDYTNVDKDGNIIVSFATNDTVCLLPGLYYYQIKAKLPLNDGTFAVSTIVPKTPFYILE